MGLVSPSHSVEVQNWTAESCHTSGKVAITALPISRKGQNLQDFYDDKFTTAICFYITNSTIKWGIWPIYKNLAHSREYTAVITHYLDLKELCKEKIIKKNTLAEIILLYMKR